MTSRPETTTTDFMTTFVSSSAVSPAVVDAVPRQHDAQNSSLSTSVITGIAVGTTSCVLLCVAAVWSLVEISRRGNPHLQDNKYLHGPSTNSGSCDQRVYHLEAYTKPELDLHTYQVSNGSFKNRHSYTTQTSELSTQNQTLVEVPA